MGIENRQVKTVADLARLAGVSTSTVSRALAGNPVIKQATRDRVARLASEHGFQLNQQARNLRMKCTRSIAVILPLGHETGQHVSDPFFVTILGHIADALTERGYDLLLQRVIPAHPNWLEQLVDSGRVDGVIVIGQSDQVAALDRVAARYLPLVVWGQHLPGHGHLTVGSDNRLGGTLATRHLIDLGRRRLAFFGIPTVPEIAERRCGFLDACTAAEPDVTATTVPVHLSADIAHAMIGDYLDTHAAPDGIFAASDVVAMSAIRALAERGLSVPADVAVIGFDDVTLAAHTSPPLTTVRQDIAGGAKLLVDLLLQRLADGSGTSQVLVPQLIVRGTTAPA
jgi:DNA-binding LacI/PurR family transcriptional regulator